MKRLFLFPMVLLLLAVLIFSGCGKAAPETPQEIRVGSTLSLTGMYAGFGEGGSFALKAAVEDINKLGGVMVKEYGKKLPVKLIIADNESDPNKAATLAEDLVLRDKVNFLVGDNRPPPFNAAVATVAERYKMPHIFSNPREPWLGLRESATTPWKYSWSTGFAIGTPAPPGDFRAKPGYTILDTWLATLGAYANQTNKKIGLFATDEPDGRGWYSLFPPALEKAGYDVLGEEKQLGLFPLETMDYTSLVNEWKKNNCDLLLGIHTGPGFGTMWRQCIELGYRPKIVACARGALFYTDVVSWGGDLPNGIGLEINWRPSYKESPGIGGTTPQSLYERWLKETNKPLNQNIGLSYPQPQILFDAIERAGTLNGDAVNKALSETDLMTIAHRVKYDKDQFSGFPLAYTQWQKTDKPWVWECPIVYSDHTFAPAEAKMLFPIPYK